MQITILFLKLCLILTDVEDVKFVINFDYPKQSEDYIHRIGRTGRSQQTGTAYTLFTAKNARQANDRSIISTITVSICKDTYLRYYYFTSSYRVFTAPSPNRRIENSVLWITL